MEVDVSQRGPGLGDAPPAVLQELVLSKLAAPSLRAGYVTRERLIDALAVSRGALLTLVAAPTGYGKTMLLAAWCATRRERESVWLSLGAGENDPALLTRYLIDALRPAGSEVGSHARAMLGVPGASPIAWMRSLVNDLATVGTPRTLVLDDYHVISEPACHELVQFLLEHAPSQLHLIISTRADPPLALGSLRARGQLVEIRAADLRFTAREARELLVEREGLSLDQATVANLAARTEGWAAGLYLAALWLRAGSVPQADAGRFAGDNRHVVDYLSEVILDRLDEGVRDFLLATSIVDRLCTSLGEALTGRRAVGLLEEIERSNLFVVPLDQTRTWYRYHQLFREMLQSELSRRHPELVAGLHRRASGWYRTAGLVTEAVEHATAAGDFDSAAELIGEHWLRVGRAGQGATVRRWLEGFGQRELSRYPQLGVIGGLSVGVSGGPEVEFRRWLAVAEDGLSRDHGDGSPVAGTTSLRAGVNLLRSSFGYRDVGSATVAAARAVQAESESSGEFRVAALANLAFLLYLSGDSRAARQAVSEAVSDPQAQRKPYGYITALTTAALIALDEGDAQTGERTARRALEYAAAVGLADNVVCGSAHVALGRALSTARRFKPAAHELRRGVELLRDAIVPLRTAYALLWAAPVMQALGDTTEALALVEEAETLLASLGDAGVVTALLGDVQRRVSRAHRRRGEPHLVMLTDTELAVLRLLRSPRSRRAIALELSVSINTVKTHTSAVYRKLGVTCRDDAVARAIETRLL